MSADEYVPSDQDMENRYVLWSLSLMDFQPEDREAWAEKLRAEFLRGLARVRRGAVQQFIEACEAKRDEPALLLPLNHWKDIEAAIRVAESYVKNHPEETDR